MLQSPQLKYHVHTIGIHPSLSNNAIYEHKFLANIKILYKQAGKCDDQQQFKDILEADISLKNVLELLLIITLTSLFV